jgi:hypothetical protein
MNQFMKRLAIVWVLITAGQLGFAVVPNWTINPANYSLDFTVVGTLNYNGNYSISTNDKLAAFDTQGNIRGVANVSYNSLAGKYLVNLTVLGNTTGDSIVFKFYNANADTVVEAINHPIIFQTNALFGNAISPYIITNVNVPFGVHLHAAAFADSVPVGTYIGKLSMDVFDSTISNSTYAFTDSIGNSDSINFYIQNDSLFTNALFNYDVDSVFTIKIKGTEQGISVFNTFEVRVYKHIFTGVYGLYLNAPHFADTVSIHTYVGQISMDLFDSTMGLPSYSFTDSVGNVDSSFFYIQNDSLFTNDVFNYDSNYIFFLKIKGSFRGLTVYNSFEVRIFKSVTPVGFGLSLDAPIFSESVGIDTYVGELSMSGYDTTLGVPTYSYTDTVGNIDSSFFYIRNDSLFTNALFNYDSNYIFFLKIHGEVLGQTVYETFQVRISKAVPVSGYPIFLDAPIFADSVAIGTYVGKLRMTGFDTNLFTPTFAFIDSIGNADSTFFYIRNDSLFTNALFNYDSNYIFFLKIKGSVLGLTSYKTFQVRVSNATPNSIEDKDQVEFSMFPNPTRDQVTILLNKSPNTITGINFYSVSGQLVKHMELYGQSQLSIDITAFEKGIYLVETISPLSRNVKRLIVY